MKRNFMRSWLAARNTRRAERILERARNRPETQVSVGALQQQSAQETEGSVDEYFRRYAGILRDPPSEVCRIRKKLDLAARYRSLDIINLVTPTDCSPPNDDPEEIAWVDFLWTAFSYPRLYEQYKTKFRAFSERAAKISQKADELSRLLAETEDGLYSSNPAYFPRFSGLIWEQIYSDDWHQLLSRFEELSNSKDDQRLLEMHFQHLDWLNATHVLRSLLKEYFQAVSNSPLAPEDLDLLQSHSRKSNKRLFTQRLVFEELRRYWTEPRRAPNKATADLVNLIFDLSGSDKVTADHISKMNENTRRRYWKDEDSG